MSDYNTYSGWRRGSAGQASRIRCLFSSLSDRHVSVCQASPTSVRAVARIEVYTVVEDDRWRISTATAPKRREQRPSSFLSPASQRAHLLASFTLNRMERR